MLTSAQDYWCISDQCSVRELKQKESLQWAGITPQRGTWCVSWDNNAAVCIRFSEPK